MNKIYRAGILALVLLGFCCAAMSESAFDFSGFTLTELYEIRDMLDARIAELEKEEGARHFGPGSYLVGTDIPEGNYTLVEHTDAVFPSVVVRTNENVDSALILHKLISGQADIHLKKSVWVSFSELEAWPMGMEPEFSAKDGKIPEGAYLVGQQLEAGIYRVELIDKAPLSSYSVYSDILCTDARLTKFEVLHEPTLLELRDGDYVELSGCTLLRLEQETENDQEG